MREAVDIGMKENIMVVKRLYREVDAKRKRSGLGEAQSVFWASTFLKSTIIRGVSRIVKCQIFVKKMLQKYVFFWQKNRFFVLGEVVTSLSSIDPPPGRLGRVLYYYVGRREAPVSNQPTRQHREESIYAESHIDLHGCRWPINMYMFIIIMIWNGYICNILVVRRMPWARLYRAPVF